MASQPAPKPTPAPAAKSEKAPRVERTQDEKRMEFISAAPGRVDRVLKAVSSLRTIARPVRYLWTDEERNAIFKAIAEAVNDCEAGFRTPGKRSKSGFSF